MQTPKPPRAAAASGGNGDDDGGAVHHRRHRARCVENVTVNVMGPVDREVKSPASGPTRIEGLRAGTYRVRFTHEKFITFEKEISWRAGTARRSCRSR